MPKTREVNRIIGKFDAYQGAAFRQYQIVWCFPVIERHMPGAFCGVGFVYIFRSVMRIDCEREACAKGVAGPQDRA